MLWLRYLCSTSLIEKNYIHVYLFRVEKQRLVIQEKAAQQQAALQKAKQAQLDQENKQRTSEQIKAQMEEQLKKQRLAMQQKRAEAEQKQQTPTQSALVAKLQNPLQQKVVLQKVATPVTSAETPKTAVSTLTKTALIVKDGKNKYMY